MQIIAKHIFDELRLPYEASFILFHFKLFIHKIPSAYKILNKKINSHIKYILYS